MDRTKIKVGVMQPYLFPYIGYFQLINAVDEFLFYDTASFIRQGWINRNRLLTKHGVYTFTIPCLKISSNKKIRDVEYRLDNRSKRKLFRTIEESYSRAPYFDPCMEIITRVFDCEYTNISQLCYESVRQVVEYLNIQTNLHICSKGIDHFDELSGTSRILALVNEINGEYYINMEGGRGLYDKDEFERSGLKLRFLSPKITKYRQLQKEFIGGLSIIDVIMNNSKKEILKMLEQFEIKH